MAEDLSFDLGPSQLRVLGSLLEKERTVPASYPMTLNAVRTACNQSSGRDPILDLDEPAVQGALDDLRSRGLTRVVHASHGARVVKYRQVLDEVLLLTDGERAVLTLLVLRGPQTPGELRTRSERLHRFEDLDEVDSALRSLAARPEPLVIELERGAGQKERRWVHRLAAEAAEAADDGAGAERNGSGDDGHTSGPAAASSAEATEAVLRDGGAARDEAVVAAYDAVATAYAAELADELDAKPFDRWLLERVAALAGDGPIADVGCGPGHVALYLAAAGADVTGFDLSPAMVAEASRRYPELAFAVADLRALPDTGAVTRSGSGSSVGHSDGEIDVGAVDDQSGVAATGGWAGLVAWYALIHLAGSELAPAIAALAGSLRPGGWLAMAVHVGPEVQRLQEWWDEPVDLAFALHDPDQVLDAVASAGLVDVEWYRRGPYRGAEVETERLYVLSRRPG